MCYHFRNILQFYQWVLLWRAIDHQKTSATATVHRSEINQAVKMNQQNPPKNEFKTYSTLTLKSVDDEKREISGIASTPRTDRDGDIVDPGGALFKTPFPLLSQHDHQRPIGTVDTVNRTNKGLEIVANIPKDTGLNYVDMAWKQIKAGLLRGLSIGFRPLEYEPIETGYKFLKYEIFELSAVTIPSNASASIQSIKHFANDPTAFSEHLFEQESRRIEARKKALAAMEKASFTIGAISQIRKTNQ